MIEARAAGRFAGLAAGAAEAVISGRICAFLLCWGFAFASVWGTRRRRGRGPAKARRTAAGGRLRRLCRPGFPACRSHLAIRGMDRSFRGRALLTFWIWAELNFSRAAARNPA